MTQNKTPKKMVKHSAIYAAGNISRQLAGFIMLPIYTTYLSPADYGVIALLTFAISLVEIVFGAQLIQAVPKFYYDKHYQLEKNSIVSTALIITFAATASMTAILFFNRDLSAELLFNDKGFSLIIGLFSILLVTQASENYGMTYIRMQQRPWLFVSISLLKLVIQLSLNIWLVVIEDWGVLGVASSAALSSGLFALCLTAHTTLKTGLHFSKKMAAKMFNFCWPLWIGALAAIYIGSANSYYMKVFSSLEDIGYFQLAAKLASIVGILIWGPFSMSWQIDRFTIYNQNNAKHTYQSIFTYITTLLIITGLGVCLYSTPIIKIMANEAFRPASTAVPLLILSGIFTNLIMFCNFSFHLKEQTRFISKHNYMAAIIITPFYLLLIPKFGYVGAALGLLITAIIHFYITLRASRRFYDMGLKMAPVLVKIALAVIAYTISEFVLVSSNFWYDIAQRSAVAMIAIAAMIGLLWRDPDRQQELRPLLVNTLKKLHRT